MSKSMDEIRQTFEHFDRNGNGTIEVGELARLLEALGASPSAEELAAGLEALDGNRNGMIDFDEFVAWWSDR
ncbi:MAG: EF-hand domain-containing protein [Myxococcota bacterium]|nr:EF-hand domain-containing protein [Myxococcota bacterium]